MRKVALSGRWSVRKGAACWGPYWKGRGWDFRVMILSSDEQGNKSMMSVVILRDRRLRPRAVPLPI